MSHQCFEKLFMKLACCLRKASNARGNAFKKFISLNIRVVLDIRVLGGSEVGDLQTAFNIPIYTIYYILEGVVDSINSCLSLPGICNGIKGSCNLLHSFKVSRKYLNPLT